MPFKLSKCRATSSSNSNGASALTGMPSCPAVSLLVTVTWRGSFLAADLSINCDSQRYHSMVAYSSFMVLVFPLGFPLSYLLAMWSALPHVYPKNAGRIFDRRLLERTSTSYSGDEDVKVMSEDEQDAWERKSSSSCFKWLLCASCHRPCRSPSADAQAPPTQGGRAPFVLISIDTYNVAAEHIEAFEMHIRMFLFDILRRRFVMRRYGTGWRGRLRSWLSQPLPQAAIPRSGSGADGANRHRRLPAGVDPNEFNPNDPEALSDLVSKVVMVGSCPFHSPGASPTLSP